jgi:hypothetical protein
MKHLETQQDILGNRQKAKCKYKCIFHHFIALICTVAGFTQISKAFVFFSIKSST